MAPRTRTLARLGAALGLASLGAIGACGTDAVGIDACREIEAARCQRAKECNIALTPPNPAGDPVVACKRFYLDACMHGIQSGKDPSVAERKACVEAVASGSCDVVREPQRAPGCAFVIPPTEGSATATQTAAPTATPAPPAPQPDAGK